MDYLITARRPDKKKKSLLLLLIKLSRPNTYNKSKVGDLSRG